MNSVKKQFLEKKLLGLAKRREKTTLGETTFGFNKIIRNQLTIKLTDIWGFCYGVLYALEAAGQALDRYHDRSIWILGELIHNPLVNQELKNLGAKFIELDEIHRVQQKDVVIIPAFGTKKDVLKELRSKDIELINTTCPEVQTVEEEVKQFNRRGYTAIIHGKYSHQETIATRSYAADYLLVRNFQEARYVCDYILNNGDKKEFLRKFDQACSKNFDPEIHLEKIGVANQTTMLMNDSLKIIDLFKKTLLERDGNLANFRCIETICSATQDRQDAVKELIKNNHFELFIVVGGHNSSNTQNLARTVKNSSDLPVYHIEQSSDISKNRIEYLPPGNEDKLELKNWLPPEEITIGLTAGASTPHSQLEEVIEKILSFY